MKEYTVKEVSSLLNKHEETIKRWLRANKFPNAFCKTDKEGWRIPKDDLINLNLINISVPTPVKQLLQEQPWQQDVTEQQHEEPALVKLAYEAVTLTSPTEEMLHILSVFGIKRTLEILLIMQQSATKVKNPDGFIKKAIRENWTPSSLAVKMSKKQSKNVYDLTQQDHNRGNQRKEDYQSKIPFYNWLEE
ncbi:helix-turn-helix domain-containing protein [Bacillus rhizoplanae]|uniref:helix-turn-helix domain-containing protein n=1 Tax=Bacillus rhizoplanae TaxID=2880966 RepID=UPI003D208DFC